MAIAPERMGIGIHRHFTTEGVHPYDQVGWERRDARITNYATGAVAFEQLGVEVPESWSVNATNILAQKYFRGTLGLPEREWSLKQVVDRVADTITAWGVKDGYFVDEAEAEAFLAELKYLVVTQRAAFNSPVWFNIGVKGVPQQASACQPYHALVCTPDGLIPIGSLVEAHAVGAKVFDAHGLTRIVAVKENGIKRVLRIRTRAGLWVDVTPDHLVWRDGPGTPGFVEAGMIGRGDKLSWYATSDEAGPGAPLGKPVSVESVEDLDEMPVYDIQTESGEYLSGNLRVHNCFILSVDDTMDSILNWYAEEGIIFKGGSGAGINLSKIRSSKEGLQGGGTASGPVSFMRGADASAGTIKSGGKTRRAAKMVILDADHPDIEDFIWCKAIEERKARALRDAGFDMDLDGKDSYSIQYQNANNSVRVTDEFMQAVLDDADWHLHSVTTSEVLQTMKARDLFRQIAKAAWECADPGMQFDTTINRWHTAPNTGRINGSNPCSEYMHLDNSACNLASLNLMKFLNDDGTFDVEGFKAATEVIFTAQEILVGNADYPTAKIAENARKFRELGIGYANIGALLMAQGLPYDSDAGRAWAASITALLTGHSYATSARIAARMGPFAGYTANREAMLEVLRMHRAEAAKIDEERVPPELLSAAQQSWDNAAEAGEQFGVRNSQASVLAPTGCLVGGSLVATERGLVRLQSLGDPGGSQWQELGIDVATDDGPRRASRFYVNGVEPVVNITTSRGHQIRGTTKHRIKVVDPATGNWEWKRFSDLKPDDVVPMALDQMVGDPQAVPLPPLSEAYWTGEHHARVTRVMTPALAELIGYFMGDGSLHSRGLRFCVTAGDVDVIDRLVVLGKEAFGLEAATTPMRGYAEVRFDSVRLALWWEACGFAKRAPHAGHRGKGYAAHIPDAVLHANDPAVYAAFLRGLFEADGDTSAGYPTLKNTSIGLVRDAQTMLLALGFPTTFSIHDRTDSSWGRAPLAYLRLLNTSYNDRWLDEVGFISSRKSSGVGTSRNRQAGRGDHIPVPRSMIDRLAPTNDRLRRILLMEAARGTISRRIATELVARTGDPELRHLLSFFYDRVVMAELGEEELTFDISVPDNLTYVANGFISHNTIGLLMDCDTTGIEPDLSLVKMKKLVGGGTMSIVNQTVPRALERLGYSDGEVEAIVAYIDEHKSIVGAPALKPEHLPVFACSMGDNTIHHRGHIRMMGAVQPFISGAISKTVNVPETVTVEDVEQLHIEAWQLGLKAVAIYRDNCKVAQPLATAKKTVTDPSASPSEVHDAELALKVADLEKALDRQTVVVKQPIRERLPRRRNSSTWKFRVADCEGYVTVGEYEDGRPGEVFMKVSKQGSTLAGIMDAFSIAVSLGLQHGVPLATFVQKYTSMRFEPAGMTDDPDLRIAASLVDYIFRRLAVDYLSLDERAELGILTTEERTQPTLPGVEEVTTLSSSVVEASRAIPAASASTADPAAQHSDAPYCYQCGVQMVRAGSCHACPSCGTTSGCS
jgi:ribonucleoside-diphosphate reductase alpha chain